MNPNQEFTLQLLADQTVKGEVWTSSWDVAKLLAAAGMTRKNGQTPTADTAARFLAPLKKLGLIERQMQKDKKGSYVAHWRLTAEGRAFSGI